jgi:hypothetical protein
MRIRSAAITNQEVSSKRPAKHMNLPILPPYHNRTSARRNAIVRQNFEFIRQFLVHANELHLRLETCCKIIGRPTRN